MLLPWHRGRSQKSGGVEEAEERRAHVMPNILGWSKLAWVVGLDRGWDLS